MEDALKSLHSLGDKLKPSTQQSTAKVTATRWYSGCGLMGIRQYILNVWIRDLERRHQTCHVLFVFVFFLHGDLNQIFRFTFDQNNHDLWSVCVTCIRLRLLHLKSLHLLWKILEKWTPGGVWIFKYTHLMWFLDQVNLRWSKCDPTQENDADVVRRPNCDFAVNVFYGNQESFDTKISLIPFSNSKIWEKTKLIC